MAVAEEEIRIYLKAQIENGIRKLDKVGKKAQTTRQKVEKLKMALSGMFGAFLKGGAILAGVGYGLAKLIKPASNFIEANNRMKVVFSGMETEALAVMERLRTEYHLSKEAATEYLGSIGDLLTGFGLTKQASLELADSTVRLATDLSSFANIPVDQAVDAITKSFSGEREGLKSLGVVISEELVKGRERVVQQKMIAKGFKGTREELERTARAQATFQLIQEQSKNAIGDFNRSLGESLPNKLKVLTSKIKDELLEIGTQLIPQAHAAIEGILNIFRTDAEKLANQSQGYISKYLEAVEKKDEKEIKFWKDILTKRLDIVNKEIENHVLNLEIKDPIQSMGLDSGLGAYGVEKVIEKRTIKGKESMEKAYKEFQKSLANNESELLKTQAKIENGDDDIKNKVQESRLKEIIKNEKIYIRELEKAIAEEDRLSQLKERIIKTQKNKSGKNPEEITEDQASKKADIEIKIEKNKVAELLRINQGYGKTKEEIEIDQLKKQLEIINQVVSKSKQAKKNPMITLTEEEKEVAKNAEAIKKNINEMVKDLEERKKELKKKAELEIKLKGDQELKSKLEQIKKYFNQVADVASKSFNLIAEAMNTQFENELMLLDRNFNTRLEQLEIETENETELKEFKQQQEEEDFERKFGITQQEYLLMDEKKQKEFEVSRSKSEQEELLNLKAVKSRQERDKEIIKLEKEKEQQEKAIKSKQFEAEKRNSIIQVAIDTARGIMNAVAQSPLTFGLPWSAFIGVTGGIQMGIISNKQNPYAYREGGIATSPQVATLAEGGRPEMILPPSLTQMMLDLSRRYQTGNEVKEDSEDTPAVVNSYNTYQIIANDTEDFNDQVKENMGGEFIKQ